MRKRKILIIGDDASARRVLGIRVRQSGYETTFAEDAALAATVAKRERPDPVVLDIGLPGGHWFTVMDRLGRIPALADVPVIVVSARDKVAHEEQVFAAGAKAYFQKPLDYDDLLEAIRRVLGEAC